MSPNDETDRLMRRQSTLCHVVWDIMALNSPSLDRERNPDDYLVVKLLCLFKKV